MREKRLKFAELLLDLDPHRLLLSDLLASSIIARPRDGECDRAGTGVKHAANVVNMSDELDDS